MDSGVAQGASLILLRLIVESRCGGRSCLSVQRMAAHAQQIDLILLQQSGVCGAVGRMTSHASFNFGFVLINERALLIGVALVASLVLSNRRAELVPLEAAVRIVAVVALHQPFIHSMMKRASELCPDVHVAAIAKFRR